MSEMSVEQEAESMGWKPESEYRGVTPWVDAETYVEKGRHVLPILKKNNERLLSELGDVKGEVIRLKTMLDASSESIEAMKEFHAEATKAQVAKARKEILDSLKEAKVDGDVEAEVEITSELSRFDAAQLEVKPDKPVQATKTEKADALETAVSPEFTAWAKENTWFGEDPERTGLAIGVAQRLRKDGDITQGAVFMAKVTANVEAVFGGGAKRADKVEGSRGGGQLSTGTSYADMPAEARAACDKQGVKHIGEGRGFKTQKDWREYYAKLYF